MFEKFKERKEKIEKYNKEKFEDMLKIIFKKTLSEIKPMGYVENVPIIKNNYIIKSVGTIFAVMILNNKGEYYIVVDSLFDELSSESKQFVLAHELAHKQLKHLENNSGLLNNLDNEIEADEFASKRYGIDIASNAFDELIKVAKSILTTVQFLYFKKIIKKRKKYLSK